MTHRTPLTATVAAALALAALPATGLAGTPGDIYKNAADREAQRFLRGVGPASSIAALPSGPCMVLDRRRAVCQIAVLIRVQVAADGSTEPWRCEAYVIVGRRHGRTWGRRTSAECRPEEPPVGTA